jgi:D-3-phosphoglycerate dehydrogenase
MKAFVTSEFSPEALQALRDLLKDDVVYESWRDTRNLYFDASVLAKKIKEIGAEIYICEGDEVKKDLLEQIDLKIIGSTRDDPNNVAVKMATEKKIPVLFAPKRNTISVAELAVTVIMALAKNLHRVERVIHSKEFQVNEFADYVKYYNLFKGFDLFGKTIGIVGLGAIGFEVAKRLVPFNVRFLVFDPYVMPARLTAINGKAVDLDTLMAQSDIITVHCPPTDETDGLIGEAQLKKMKPTAYFVNLARASVTDEAALLELLKEKKIAGAALDVFTVEPVDQDNEFLKLDNVIVTPHLGGDTLDTNHRHAMMMVNGIAQILKHQIPPNCKNPEVLENAPPAPAETIENVPISPVPDSLQYYAPQAMQIIDVCKKMVAQGFITGSAGNVSMRVKLRNGEDAYLVTASTKDYDSQVIEDLVLVDANANTLLGTRNPTSERRMHIAIYQARPDINAVIHSHSCFSTALSIAKMPIGPIVDEVIPFIGGCEVAEYGEAGTPQLAQNAIKALGENYACFIANHGNICCGANMPHAYTVLQQVEMAAKVQYHASLLGTIYALPEEAEEHEKEIFQIMKDSNSTGM